MPISAGSTASASTARIEWRSSSCSIRVVRPWVVSREELVAEVEVAALDAAAFEDAFGELVALQPQPLEHLLLGVAALGVRDGDPGDPRAGGPRRRGALGRAAGTADGLQSAIASGTVGTLWLSEGRRSKSSRSVGPVELVCQSLRFWLGLTRAAVCLPEA